MARPNKPWYRASSDAWVVKIAGRQYTLCRGKANRHTATKAFHSLMASLGTVEVFPGDLSISALIDHYLDAAQERLGPDRFALARLILPKFRDFVGRARLVSQLRPADVARWFDGRDLAPSSQQTYLQVVTRCLNWGVREGLIVANPFRNVKGPGYQQRGAVITRDQAQAILDEVKEPFKVYLEFLWETGSRPSEGFRLEACHCFLSEGLVRMPSKTTRRTGRLRTIYLTPRAIEILTGRIAARPEGPLFVNSLGAPWTRYSLSLRFRALRRKLGMGSEATAEAFRHAFGTDGALRLKPLVLAELMGHASTKILERYYTHLDQRATEMRAAAREVRGSS